MKKLVVVLLSIGILGSFVFGQDAMEGDAMEKAPELVWGLTLKTGVEIFGNQQKNLDYLDPGIKLWDNDEGGENGNGNSTLFLSGAVTGANYGFKFSAKAFGRSGLYDTTSWGINIGTLYGYWQIIKELQITAGIDFSRLYGTPIEAFDEGDTFGLQIKATPIEGLVLGAQYNLPAGLISLAGLDQAVTVNLVPDHKDYGKGSVDASISASDLQDTAVLTYYPLSFGASFELAKVFKVGAGYRIGANRLWAGLDISAIPNLGLSFDVLWQHESERQSDNPGPGDGNAKKDEALGVTYYNKNSGITLVQQISYNFGIVTPKIWALEESVAIHRFIAWRIKPSVTFNLGWISPGIYFQYKTNDEDGKIENTWSIGPNVEFLVAKGQKVNVYGEYASISGPDLPAPLSVWKVGVNLKFAL